MEGKGKIKNIVKEKYAEIAKKSEEGSSCSCCCSGSQAADIFTTFSPDYSKKDGYMKDADLGLGCGIPTDTVTIKPGETVIDLGSGAGNDVFIAQRLVGTTGTVIGIDMTEAMIERARQNAKKLGYTNVEFRLGEIEQLPVEDNAADVVVSNCVINLVPDKLKAFQEVYRVLKPGGNLIVSVPRFYPEKICWLLSKEYYNSDGGHIRIYTQKQITAIFERFGLRQRSSHFAHSLHTPYWWLKCLLGLNREDALPVTLYKRFLTWDIMEKPWITRFTDSLLNPVLGKSLVVYFKKE